MLLLSDNMNAFQGLDTDWHLYGLPESQQQLSKHLEKSDQVKHLLTRVGSDVASQIQLDWLQKNQLNKGLDTSNRLLCVDYIANELGHSNNNQSYRDKIKEKLERKFERIKHPFPRKKVVPLLGGPKMPLLDDESDNRWEPDTKEAFEQFKS